MVYCSRYIYGDSFLGIAGGFGAGGAVLFNYFVGQLIDTLGAEKIFIAIAFIHPIAIIILWSIVNGRSLQIFLNRLSKMHNNI